MIIICYEWVCDFYVVLNYCLFCLDKDNKQKDAATEEGQSSVPAAVLAKVLEERVKERLAQRHCYTCLCANKNGDLNIDQQKCNTSLTDSSERRASMLTKNTKKPMSTKSSESLTSELDMTSSGFDYLAPTSDSSDNGLKLSARSRVCSVRLQEGSNNILLDNAAAPYSSPVLYKSRSSSGEFDEPLVHSQKLIDRNAHANEHTTRILISDDEIV